MKKYKSKSNILSHPAKQPKLKPHDKLHLRQKSKTSLETKKLKFTEKQASSSKNLFLKSTIPFQKFTNPSSKRQQLALKQQLLKSKNCGGITLQRSSSKISNKRSSAVSHNSQKVIKEQKIEEKENNLNCNNLQQIKENQFIVDQKRLFEDFKTKKKLSLNISTKPHKQLFHGGQSIKKQKKSGKLKQFQIKMSKYLKQKNLFCEKFKIESKPQKKKSEKKIVSKSSQKQNKKDELEISKNQKNNLLEIYKFYKKTFDINFSNCMKKNSNFSKESKSKHTFSKSILKPCHSSIMIAKKQGNSLFQSQINHLWQKKNQKFQTSRSTNNQALGKSRKKEAKSSQSILDKQNRVFSQIQRSLMYESRSKEKNSMINSQSSTKDHILSYNFQRDQIKCNKQEKMNFKPIKKSCKKLIVFQENQTQNSKKQMDRIRSNSTHQPNSLNVQNRNQQKQKDSLNSIGNKQFCQMVDLQKMEIGSSNLDVLKWWSNDKNQELGIMAQIVIKKYDDINKQSAKKNDLVQNSFNQEQKTRPQNQVQDLNRINNRTEQLQKNQKDHQSNNKEDIMYVKVEKKQQIQSLDNLSSISSIHNQVDYEKGEYPKIGLGIQDEEFEF